MGRNGRTEKVVVAGGNVSPSGLLPRAHIRLGSAEWEMNGNEREMRSELLNSDRLSFYCRIAMPQASERECLGHIEYCPLVLP
jgi:hypothetical protein